MTQQTTLSIRAAKMDYYLKTKPITPEEKAQCKKATSKILLYFAVLNVAVFDIKDEFAEVGRFRQLAKATINDIERNVCHLFNLLRGHILFADKKTCHNYDNWNTEISLAIDEAILLTAPERSYNIALACCRLIVAENDKLGRWCIGEAMPLPHIIRKLERLAIHDYHIDNIIELTIAKFV